VRLGIERSRAAGKPFALVINVSDPHKPFYGMGPRDMLIEDPRKPSRIFAPEEVPIPGFLFDHPDVRLELAHYYSSVRRADDCVGESLKALDESGQRDETLVVFLSDHGMPLPFAKTGLWYHSTRTPLIIRWPGVTRPGAIDAEHLVSAVDLLPTLLDALQIRHSAEFDGRSFLPLLRGEASPGWDVVFTEHNENAGGNRNPMRGVVTRQFLYLYNPWVNGTRQFATATRGTLTYRTMKKLAPQDPALAARLAHLELGVPEEFYDYENDPDALHNLIDDPRYQDEIARHRQLLEEWMVRTGDHALEAFRQRGDRSAQEAYMQRLEAEAAERNKAPRRNRAAVPDSASGATPQSSPPASAVPGAAKTPPRRRGGDYLTLVPPRELPAGGEIVVVVRHRLPAELGPQPIHVTLKQGQAGRRVARQVLTARGDGEATATFQLPAEPTDGVVSFAAFVGKDFESSLQHVTIPPRPVAVQECR
jgi:N-sulfoglucosamine sulfohydrolase